jgi:protein involved in polysaccharide export with SLBB domain
MTELRTFGSVSRTWLGSRRRLWALLLLVVAALAALPALAQPLPPVLPKPPADDIEEIPKPNFAPEQPSKPEKAATPTPAPESGKDAIDSGPLSPFGARLFTGNFLHTRQDGLNPDYVVMPGDRVQVHTWGALELSNVFVTDAQGNIFVPGVGPIQVAGTRNADLTQKVKAGLARVYARNFEVYTNLLTAKPVAVFVTGGVKRPGRYAGVPSDSILFFLEQAGGIEPRLGSYRSIAVLRNGTIVTKVDLYDFLLRGQLPPMQFKDGDTILVNQRGAVIDMRGDVALPAMLEFPSKSFSGTEALSVIPGAARATQVTIQGIRQGVPISRTFSVEQFRSFRLEDGDAITLRGDGRADTILVKLEGEYKGPSVLAVRRGSRLVDVLNYVSVDPVLSNPGAVHLKRTSVAQAQKYSIGESLFRLERSALLALSNSQGEANIRVREAELTQKFVERARLIQPLGRVPTVRDGRQRNVVLEQDDVIVIPARTNVVRVGGEIMMTQAVMFLPEGTAEDYIEQSGGYTDRSDRSKVIIIHADAQISIGDPDMPVAAGDEILVPPKVDAKTLQNAVDITQVIYQIAVSAAVVIAIL